MTYQTKSLLREKLEYKSRALDTARTVLKGAGYTEQDFGLGIVNWYAPKNAVVSIARDPLFSSYAQKRDADKHRAQGRHEALALVIEALELFDYGHVGLDETDPFTAEEHAERIATFEADLRTTIRVRKEKAKADADAATARHIENLAYPGVAVTGDSIKKTKGVKK